MMIIEIFYQFYYDGISILIKKIYFIYIILLSDIRILFQLLLLYLYLSKYFFISSYYSIESYQNDILFFIDVF